MYKYKNKNKNNNITTIYIKQLILNNIMLNKSIASALYNFYATSEVDEASYLPAYMASQLLRTGVLVFCKMLVQIR